MVNDKTPKKDDRVQMSDKPKEEEKSPLKKLLETTDVLLMLYPKDDHGYFSESIQNRDEITVYDLLKERKEIKRSLLLLLDTSGGNVYSAVKIMDCLRTKYTHISIAIPQEAKSSGTMMCFGADKLIMSSVAELGPLDKPLPHPDNENAFISALDIVRSIEQTITTATDRQQELAEKINNKFGIRIKGSLELAGDYIAKLISPMLSNEDVKIYNQAKRLLAIAEKYGTEFLDKHMLKYLKNDKTRKRIADYIVRQFIYLYPDHAFAIRRNDLKDLFFIVDDAEKLDYWDDLWKEFKLSLSRKSKTVRFFEN